MDKRFFIIIKPAVIHLKPVHQTFWKTAKVGFLISEFVKIERRGQASLRNAFVCDFL